MKKSFIHSLVVILLLVASCQPKTIKKARTTTTTTFPKAIDTARDVPYLSSMEKDMVAEINLVRSNPKGYIKYVQAYIEEQERHKVNGTGFGNEAEEIKTAKELIKQLKKTPRLAVLKPHKGVYKAAKVHGKEGKQKGELNHKGKNGSWPWDRVKKYAPDLTDGNENLVGGPSNIRTAVMILLVDTGIPSRGHRKTLLNPTWRYVGCYYVGQVGDMPNYWVQKFGR